MKLSVNYNFFNGEEHLETSIKNIRPYVEHVSLSYQEISNFGNFISKEALDTVYQLQNMNLVDDVILYQPDLFITPAMNEFQKRHLGLELAKKRGASHFLLCDADEYYIPKQFLYAKQYIIDHNISYSACRSYFYIQRPIYRSLDPDITNICFICKIDGNEQFIQGQSFKVDHVDPTRRIMNLKGEFKFFNVDEVAMHHMNFVRKNISSKLYNSSTRGGGKKAIQFLDKISTSLKSWKFGDDFDFGGKSMVKIVEDKNLISQIPKIVDYTDNLNTLSKKALILTNHLSMLSGSEILALEVAETLQKLGFEVSIASFMADDKINAILEEKDIQLHNLKRQSSRQFHPLELDIFNYDFVWTQHMALNLLDFSKLDNDDTIPPIIVRACLSPYENLELLHTKLDCQGNYKILCNSYETFERCKKMKDVDPNDLVNFYNACPDYFFKKNVQISQNVKRLLVVSNHVPQELSEAIKIMESYYNIEIVIAGGENPKTISVEYLQSFDAVITIGKTVLYALASNVPVYIYDSFGGDGWLTKDNFEQNMRHNFSGRPNQRKLDAEALAAEIMNGYINHCTFKPSNDFLNKINLKNYLEHFATVADDQHYRRNTYKNKLQDATKNMQEDYFLINNILSTHLALYYARQSVSKLQNQLNAEKKSNKQLKSKLNKNMPINKPLKKNPLLFIIDATLNDPSVKYRNLFPLQNLNRLNIKCDIIHYNDLDKFNNADLQQFILQYQNLVLFRPCAPVENRALKVIYNLKDKVNIFASYDDPLFNVGNILKWKRNYKKTATVDMIDKFRLSRFWFELFDNFIASTLEMKTMILEENPNANVIVAENYIPSIIYDHCQYFMYKDREKKIFMPQGGFFHQNNIEHLLNSCRHIYKNHGYQFELLDMLYNSIKPSSPAIELFQRKSFIELCCYFSKFQLAIAPIFDFELAYTKSDIKILETSISGTHLVASSIPSIARNSDYPFLTIVDENDDWEEKTLLGLEASKQPKANFDRRQFLVEREQKSINQWKTIIEA